jgi:hypothetical protein
MRAAAGMTAGDVWRVLRANTWLIIVGLILSGIIGYGANWFLNRYYARFTARGWIQINATRAQTFVRLFIGLYQRHRMPMYGKRLTQCGNRVRPIAFCRPIQRPLQEQVTCDAVIH